MKQHLEEQEQEQQQRQHHWSNNCSPGPQKEFLLYACIPVACLLQVLCPFGEHSNVYGGKQGNSILHFFV